MESTRADLHETVEALERKLSPGQLVDELWGRMRSGDGAGSLGRVVRDHPVPLALMGLGVAWLAVEQMTGSPADDLRRRHGAVGPGTQGRAEGRVGPYRGDAVSGSDGESSLGERASEAASGARSAISGAAESVTEKAKDAAGSVKERAGDVRERAREGAESLRAGADDAGSMAARRARQAKRGLRDAMDEHPLAMGALAFGLGLAGGLSAPSTRLEDRAMGDAAETVKGEAKSAAGDVAESARRVAGDAAAAAKEEADRQGVVGDMKESAKRVAAEAKDAAQRRAEEEDLDPEGLKGRGRDAASRTKDRVGE